MKKVCWGVQQVKRGGVGEILAEGAHGSATSVQLCMSIRKGTTTSHRENEEGLKGKWPTQSSISVGRICSRSEGWMKEASVGDKR